jgi:hypothetical protein
MKMAIINNSITINYSNTTREPMYYYVMIIHWTTAHRMSSCLHRTTAVSTALRSEEPSPQDEAK